MNSMSIPSYVELMYPTLVALAQLGGAAPWPEVNEAAIRAAGLTREQVEHEFADTAKQTGSKVIHRLAFARSYLKKLGAVDNAERGVWAITERGREILELGETAAVEYLHRADHELRRGFKSVDKFLHHAKQQAEVGSPLRMTVRELLAEWGAKRRGSEIVARVLSDLEEAGLRTHPSFQSGWIDEPIQLVETTTPTETGPGALPDARMAAGARAMTLTVGSLASANSGVTAVAPDDSLARAQSLMMANDFSQLAVTTGPRSLKGAVSWESIAQARLRNPAAELSDTIIPAPTVPLDAPLLEWVPRIVEAGFVFVQDRTGVISGIVTTADLSEQFAVLANPFLVIGEIERTLRQAIDTVFSPDELAEFGDPDDPDRDVATASDLTLGEHLRIFENPDAWARFDWPADRKVFVDKLDRVRLIRNDVVHFSPDPLEAGDNSHLRNFLNWVRYLVGTTPSGEGQEHRPPRPS